MHDAHTRIRLAAPFTSACTVCRFRFQRRLVTLCAWLIRLPNCGPRPHTSHTFAIVVSLLRDSNSVYQVPDRPRNRSDILTKYLERFQSYSLPRRRGLGLWPQHGRARRTVPALRRARSGRTGSLPAMRRADHRLLWRSHARTLAAEVQNPLEDGV